MNVTLNISNDEELRNHIKDVIKGQVLSIVREDIFDSIKQELIRKVQTLGGTMLERVMRQAFVEAIENILKQDIGIDRWNVDIIKPILEDRVATILSRSNVERMVNSAAEAKIRALVGTL